MSDLSDFKRIVHEPLEQAHREALADNARLRALIVEHHRVGALDSIRIGDHCPVCRAHAPEEQT